jgi:histidine triad (HIT) family protein
VDDFLDRSSRRPECVFCAIVQRRAPAHVVYESSECVAFLDAHPITRGHTLVAPRAHFEHPLELSNGRANAFFRDVRMVARLLSERLSPTGFNYGINQGVDAKQVVFHLHGHVIPRYGRGDPRDVPDLGHRLGASTEELVATAEEIHASNRARRYPNC